MTLYEFLNATKRDWDTYDTEYCAEVTVCHIEEEDDNYDRFCNGICKKVEFVEQTGDCRATVKWTELIRRNLDKFKAFTKENWYANCQYEDDEEEFIYQWICEIHQYMAGNVSDSIYVKLIKLVETLE